MFRLGLFATLLALFGCQLPSKTTELPPEKEGIRQVIGGHVGEVSDCYTAALKRNPQLSGKVILEWDINAIGDVKNPKVVQGVEPKLDACLLKRLSGWAFPPPPDNKIAHVRYPFVFAPPEAANAGEIKVAEKSAPGVAVAVGTAPAPPQNYGKRCSSIEAEYAQLCVRDAKTGECIFDDGQMGKILRLIKDSPRLASGESAELEKITANAKPVKADVEEALRRLGEDCWTVIHQRIWNSIFYSFKNSELSARVVETKALLKERIADSANPSYLGLGAELGILEKGADFGFLKPSAPAKKELSSLRAKAKSSSTSLAKEWTGGKASGDEALLPTAEWEKVEPLIAMKLLRKELDGVKTQRARLNAWIKTHWAKL